MKKLILGLFLLFQFNATADTLLIEAYGDSLTKGMLSNVPITEPISTADISKIYTALARYKASGDPKWVEPYQRLENSWPYLLGEKIKSSTTSVEVHNY